MKQLIVFVLLLLCASVVRSQAPAVPVIGKLMPDVTLTVEYVNAGITSLKDLRGKPVVIDFFSKGCTSCFASFPKLSAQYPALREKMHFILVGMDMNDNIRQGYEKFQKRLGLQLPVAYDTVLYKQWDIRAVPHSIWIDKNGIVQAISYSPREEQLAAFSEGKTFAFVDTSDDAKRIPFDSQKPFMINGNGGTDSAFVQRSLLAVWKQGMANYAPFPEVPGDALEDGNFTQVVGRPLADLYRLAYFGRTMPWYYSDTTAYARYHYSLILELSNTSLFSYNRERAENLFCYSLYRPEGGQPLRDIMQRDLKNFFGYEATVEVRRFPYLALVAKPGAAVKLKADVLRKPGKFDFTAGGEFYNLPLSFLITGIAHYNHLVAKDLPLVDETGIAGNIDIRLDAAMTNLEDVKRALQTNGLDIVQKEREMKVIVIRDSKDPINK